ncbi:MAG TPA: Hpt domain-containing protein [Candidatus Nitrosotenuis sp.]|nr:Hpt domain-containing protein [Candidatus Nitrosotenuis sp.]
MIRVLLVGFSPDLARWLQDRLQQAWVWAAPGPSQALAELGQGDWAVMAIDGARLGPEATLDLLRQARACRELHLLLCLKPEDRAELPCQLADELLFHPFEAEELAESLAAAEPVPPQLQEVLERSWREFRGLLMGQLQVLEGAAAAAARGELPEPLKEEAVQAAHQLAGSLGTYGFAQGSRLARRLEAHLRDGPLEPQGLSRQVAELRRHLEGS